MWWNGKHSELLYIDNCDIKISPISKTDRERKICESFSRLSSEQKSEWGGDLSVRLRGRSSEIQWDWQRSINACRVRKFTSWFGELAEAGLCSKSECGAHLNAPNLKRVYLHVFVLNRNGNDDDKRLSPLVKFGHRFRSKVPIQR